MGIEPRTVEISPAPRLKVDYMNCYLLGRFAQWSSNLPQERKSRIHFHWEYVCM
jgi:hypothetical protein